MYWAKIASLILLLTLIEACTSVPVTNRRQLAFLPEAQLVSMANDNYSQVLSQSKVIREGEQAEMIQRVGRRMQQAVEIYLQEKGLANEIKGYDWQFSLIDEDVANAWAMPGGKVAFYTGILPICETEAGVAVVMGHEIAHVVARHGNERMSQGLLQQGGALALDKLLESKPTETRNLFQAAYGMGSNLAFSLAYSRLHESEADEMGLMFMAIAGYDPAEAAPFWQRMSAGGQSPPEFFSTHPNPDKRAQRLQELLPSANEYYQKYKRP